MFRRSVALALLVMFLAAHALGERKPQYRAAWVWSNSMLDGAAQREDFLGSCRARRLNVLFLYAPPNRLRERGAEFHSFLAAAHATGLRVEALDGAPEWAFEHEAATTFARAVVGFNQEAAALGQRFDGLHVDVEPYHLQSWKDAPGQGADRYIEMLSAVQVAAAGLPLTADVPTWFARPDVGDLLDRAMGQVDAVAVMAYVEHAKRVKALLGPALAVAERQKKQAWAGISAQRADEDDSLLERKRFEELLRKTEKELRNARGFRGVAIHDAEHLRELYEGAH